MWRNVLLLICKFTVIIQLPLHIVFCTWRAHKYVEIIKRMLWQSIRSHTLYCKYNSVSQNYVNKRIIKSIARTGHIIHNNDSDSRKSVNERPSTRWIRQIINCAYSVGSSHSETIRTWMGRLTTSSYYSFFMSATNSIVHSCWDAMLCWECNTACQSVTVDTLWHKHTCAHINAYTLSFSFTILLLHTQT